jgi:hypothetical protein
MSRNLSASIQLNSKVSTGTRSSQPSQVSSQEVEISQQGADFFFDKAAFNGLDADDFKAYVDLCVEGDGGVSLDWFGNSGLELERGKAVYLLAPSYAGGDAGICRIETERLMCWARRG